MRGELSRINVRHFFILQPWPFSLPVLDLYQGFGLLSKRIDGRGSGLALYMGEALTPRSSHNVPSLTISGSELPRFRCHGVGSEQGVHSEYRRSATGSERREFAFLDIISVSSPCTLMIWSTSARTYRKQ
jgi:hypothetical protein